MDAETEDQVNEAVLDAVDPWVTILIRARLMDGSMRESRVRTRRSLIGHAGARLVAADNVREHWIYEELERGHKSMASDFEPPTTADIAALMAANTSPAAP